MDVLVVSQAGQKGYKLSFFRGTKDSRYTNKLSLSNSIDYYVLNQKIMIVFSVVFFLLVPERVIETSNGTPLLILAQPFTAEYIFKVS